MLRFTGTFHLFFAVSGAPLNSGEAVSIPYKNPWFSWLCHELGDGTDGSFESKHDCSTLPPIHHGKTPICQAFQPSLA